MKTTRRWKSILILSAIAAIVISADYVIRINTRADIASDLFTAFEAESGYITSPATSGNDGTSSENGYILFAGPPITPSSTLSSPTPGNLSPSPSSQPENGRILKYYGVDRGSPITDANFSTLASHSVKTVIIDTYIDDSGNSSQSKWSNIKALAAKHGFKYVIWPNQGGDVSGCRWEYPFNNPQNGDYIWRVRSLLDSFASDQNFIGLVSEHEPSSAVSSGCRTTIDDMATIKTQLKEYMTGKGRNDFKVWNYIDNVATNLKNMSGFGNEDIERVMDVAVTWQHCFGGAEGSCPSARNKILADRNLINAAGLDGKVELVYLFQTFATGGGYSMPSLSEMQQWDCDFLATGALDGFMYYTWGAWYDSDLLDHPELWAEMDRVYNSCTNHP